jgi:asparagine synthase (glutamine-hydrolysing)
MAHSLETRVPFLDNDLVDFAMKIPNSMKIANSISNADENDLFSKKQAYKEGKTILRKTLSKYLDKQVTENKKQGFSSPDASWFRGESIEFVRKEFSNIPKIFDFSVAKKIFDEHTSGLKNNRLAVWSLLYMIQFFKRMVRS